MSKLIKLLHLVNQTPIYLASFLVKRDKNIWIFGSWKGQLYNDNSKYLFEYVLNEEKDIKAFWIVKSKSLFKELKFNNKPVLYCYSPKGIYIQLKAGACFFTQSHRLDFLGSAVGRRTLLVQLWHGMPLKKILNDDEANKAQESNTVNLLLNKVFPWTIDKWDIVISPSSKAEAIFRSAFGDTIKIINSGFPRNKNLLQQTHDKINLEVKNIIYMPTFRGSASTVESDDYIEKYLTKNGFDFDVINALCNKNGINFHIKLHPSNKLSNELTSKIDSLQNTHLIDNHFDFYEDVSTFDLLITDYSSIFFDFVLTGKPIMHVAFDLEDYIADSRELYFDYNEIKVGESFYNWSEVFKNIITSNSIDLIKSENYKKIVDLMNADTKNSCENIVYEAKKYLNI